MASEYLVTLNNEIEGQGIFGYSYMEEEEVKNFKKVLKKIISREIIIPVGDSGYDLIFEDGQDCLDSLEFMKIKDNDGKILHKYFLEDNNFAITPRQIFEYISEEFYDLDDEEDYSDSEDEY